MRTANHLLCYLIWWPWFALLSTIEIAWWFLRGAPMREFHHSVGHTRWQIVKHLRRCSRCDTEMAILRPTTVEETLAISKRIVFSQGDKA